MLAAVETSRAASSAAAAQTAFLIVDIESIPDGRLLRQVKYPSEKLTDEQAIEKARQEARENSWSGSDFIPVTFQMPVAICVLNVGRDFSLQRITALDAPKFRPEVMVRQFWSGVEDKYPNAHIVTYNGRGFDLPLLELAAYRYGHPAIKYFHKRGSRYNSHSLDLQEWFTNYGAFRLVGGLNVLAKMLGLPGKMDVSGDQVYEMHREGRFQDISDYCTFDTLDTYFIFLRSRLLIGEIVPEQEAALIAQAKTHLQQRSEDMPALKIYLDGWANGST